MPVQAIELGNIPETLPSLSGSSRWSLGSISLLPTSTAQTSSVSVSCMSDDAEDESESHVRSSEAFLFVCLFRNVWGGLEVWFAVSRPTVPEVLQHNAARA